MQKEIETTKTKTGIQALWIGGGAYTKTFNARWLLHASKELKKPLFIRKGGNLASTTEQALVKINTGDLLVEYEGSLPANFNNPDARIKLYEVIALKSKKALLEEYLGPIPPEKLLPKGPKEGCNKYHNRDGGLFVDTETED